MKCKSSCRNDNCLKEEPPHSSSRVSIPRGESQDQGQEMVDPEELELVRGLELDLQQCGDKFLGVRQSWPKRMWIWPTAAAAAVATAMAIAKRVANKTDTMASIDGPPPPETKDKKKKQGNTVTKTKTRRMQKLSQKRCIKA